MKYSDLAHVLAENRSIFLAIDMHARGGPVPSFDGLPKVTQRFLESQSGRAMSADFVKHSAAIVNDVRTWDKWEATESKKRPSEVLYNQVSVTSTFIGAYVQNAVVKGQEMS